MKCWLGGLLAVWVVQIFGTSAMLAGMNAGTLPALATVWQLADEVGPVAKIAFVAVLAVLLAATRRRDYSAPEQIILWAGISGLAVLMVLALLPADFSRGFGIGFSGVRFASATLPIYIGGAVVGGMVGAVVERRCRLTGTAAR
ncbi:MAG: hypothetical protein SFV20_01730 [Sphingopyxis sp.]|nr:hypothetical protein [Sphingopyxis sp.]